MISLCGKIFTLYFKQYLLTIPECVLFYIGISHLSGSIQCVSVPKPAPAEYATIAFISK